MRFSRTLNVVDAHAEGESGKVVVGGLGPVPGDTMFDKRVHLELHLDQLRKLLLHEPRGAVWHNANVVLPSNHPDADCGTGTSARLAVLHAHGQIEPGELFRHESVIGSRFDARVEATTAVGPYDAVVPSISGRAWITSFNQLVLDPTDPFQEGFGVGRPWQAER